ncbi:MAG: hypothetical protein AB7F79_12115 [Steroidobacteraceae bacterium]
MLATSHRRANPHQSGLTLIESILALLILASCVIGIAALYAQRQNQAHDGNLHKRAIQLAQEIAAQIRSDTTTKHSYATVLGATCDAKSDKPENTTNLVACWQDQVEQQLTNGSARISVDRTTLPEQYVIIVSWSEPRSGTASYVLRVTPATTTEAVATRAAS